MSQKTYMYDTQWQALINAIDGGDTSAIATALGQIKTSIDAIETALGSLSTDVTQDSTQWTNLVNAITNQSLTVDLSDITSSAVTNLSNVTGATVTDVINALNSTLVHKPDININNILSNDVDIVVITALPTFVNGTADINIASYLPSGKKFSKVAFAVMQSTSTLYITGALISGTTLTVKCTSSYSGSIGISAMFFAVPNS